MIIAIDFDGTCVTHEYPYIGRDIGAQEVLLRLVANRHKLILWTMRSGRALTEAQVWFEKNGIPLFGVNENPDQKEWTTSPKAYATLYIDDAALGAPVIQNGTERAYLDWETARKYLWDLPK
jgi:hypothetical protein